MSRFIQQLANAHVLVVGCGASGASAARFAAAAGARVCVVDSRDEPPAAAALQAEYPAMDIRTGALPLTALVDIDQLVVSPGVDLREPLILAAREQGLAVVGDIEWFARVVSAPVVAITGSNGKSTVTAWITEIARAAGRQVAIGGNFGTPALELLADNVELYVLELSSFQLELTQSLRSRAATVLNISADHIDRHGSIDHYAALKARIFDGAEVAVVNADDARVAAMVTGNARVLSFGAARGADYRLLDEARALGRADHVWLAMDALSLAGRHNAANALAVWALAEAIGIDETIIRAGLQSFTGLPHRCQTVAEIHGVRWVNDSKGTNLGALLASLAGMTAPVILLAGGQSKDSDFSELAPVAAAKTREVIVFGRDAELIASAVEGQTAVCRVATLSEAVSRAHAIAQPGDTVLLSPGCTSFDQFDNYMRRGEAFVAAVQGLAA